MAIFLQTFWFNSELNSGIPKHNSRGTQSASAVATKKGTQVINRVYSCTMTDQGLTGQSDLWSEIQRFSEIHPASTDTHVGLAGERTQSGVSESLKQEIMFSEYVQASGKKAHSFHQTLKVAFYQKKKNLI